MRGRNKHFIIRRDTKEWRIQFLAGKSESTMYADAASITTFNSGTGANIGTISVSTDGITFNPISYPFTPVVGNYWFKRSLTSVRATLNLLQ